MARKKQSADTTPGQGEAKAELTPYAKFSPRQVHRRELKNAPYNPRVISDSAKKKLRANLKKVGLVNAIVWNKRTGNIVGGHQRLDALDALHGNDNFLVPVDEVDLDEQTEKEQNLFLNNAQAQGSWDMDLLGNVLKEVSVEAAGFDISSVADAFGEAVVGGQKAEDISELAESLRQAQSVYEKLASKGADRDDFRFYRVVVFASRDEARWLSYLLDQPRAMFVEGRRLRELVEETLGHKIDVPGGADEDGEGSGSPEEGS